MDSMPGPSILGLKQLLLNILKTFLSCPLASGIVGERADASWRLWALAVFFACLFLSVRFWDGMLLQLTNVTWVFPCSLRYSLCHSRNSYTLILGTLKKNLLILSSVLL